MTTWLALSDPLPEEALTLELGGAGGDRAAWGGKAYCLFRGIVAGEVVLIIDEGNSARQLVAAPDALVQAGKKKPGATARLDQRLSAPELRHAGAPGR